MQHKKNGKIFSCSKNGKNLEYHFLADNSQHSEARNELIDLLNKKKINYIEKGTVIKVRETLEIEIVKELFDNFLEIFFRGV